MSKKKTMSPERVNQADGERKYLLLSIVRGARTDQTLGEDYLEYKRNVPMWVPRLSLGSEREDLPANER